MKRIIYSLVITFISISVAFADNIKVNGMHSTVIKVISGNQVELQNGTKVVLLGVQDSENAKKYLEQNVKGKQVNIVADSKQQQYISSPLTTIRAYVNVAAGNVSVQRKLLLTRMAKLDVTLRFDSLKTYSDLVKTNIQSELKLSELRTVMLPATFLIRTESGIGTGFFINDNGLAITNNHVWNGNERAIIYKINDDGSYDTFNTRLISRMITTYREGKVDFTIFMVQLDNGEKSAYLPIVRQQATIGEEVAKLGCGLGNGATFNNGVLSRYNDGFLTHTIGIDGGDSGSPLCNMRGEVIGINVSIPIAEIDESGTEKLARGQSYAVDILIIKEVLEKLGIEYGR